MPDHIHAPANLVRALNLRKVRRVCVAPVGIKIRIRRRAVTPRRVAGVDARLARIPHIARKLPPAVGPRNLPNLRSPVLPIVRPRGHVAEPRIPKHAVNQKRRARIVVKAKRRQIHPRLRIANLPQPRPRQLAQRAHALHRRVHHRILAPHHQLLANVVIALHVYLVPRQRQRARRKIVARSVKSILRRLVRQRRQRLYRRPDRRQPRRRNHVVRKRLPPRPVGIARPRIKNRPQPQIPRQIPRPDIRRRHRKVPKLVRPLRSPLVAEEVEQLVLHHRPPQRKARDIHNALRQLRPSHVLLKKVRPRVQVLIVVVPERRTLQLVRTRLGRHRHRRAPRHTLLGIVRRCRNVHRLNRLHRRVVHRVMRQPNVHIRRSIHPRIVIIPVRPVHVRRQRSPRRRSHRILKRRRRRPRHQIDHALVVPVSRQRQLHHRLVAELRPRIRPVRLQSRRRRLHRHPLAHLPDFEPRFHARHVVDRHQYALPRQRPETGSRHHHLVVARQHAHHRVPPLLIGLQLSLQARLGVRQHDPRRRHRRARRIFNRPHNRSVQHLSLYRTRQRGAQQHHRGEHS